MNTLSFLHTVPQIRAAEDNSSFVSGSRIHARKSIFGARIPRFLRPGHLQYAGSCGRRFSTVARIKKGQKHEYPWPDNIDPNLESGHLAYLSYFKPLTEKPKLVTLDFEKPLVELEKKIIDVRKMSDETGLDFTDQINELESKYQQALKDLYTHLTPFQRVAIARHPNRPTFLDHVLNITDKWVELHGDRAGYDDPAIVTGLGSIEGKTYMLIGHQKGRNTKENIQRNFGMPTPHGYRKALRMMRYANHHGFPIITFIDTPGAFADLKSEELGQGEAIAFNLREMFGLKVPIVSVVIGEGGSGGALAIGCANKLFMLENAVFYVASPEACAAILWKNSQEAPKAAEKLKITGTELCKLKVADEIIPEPLGGAHTDPTWTSQQIKIKVMKTMKELGEMDTDKLLEHRYKKFRIIGEFIEGKPVEEEKKWAMKKKEADYALDTSGIEADIETLRKAVEEANGKATPATVTFEMVENLRQQVDKEITDAFIAMGLQEKLQDLKMEMSQSPDGTPSAPLRERIERLMQEFKYNLSRPGSYMQLKQKLETLGEASKLLEEKTWKEFNENLRQEQVKELIEILRTTSEKAVNGNLLDQDQVEKMNKAKEELLECLEFSIVETFGLNRRNKHAPPGREMLRKADQMINMEIEKAVDEAGLRSKIDLLRQDLKAEIEGDSNNEKIEKLQSEIKAQIAAAIDMVKLKKKVNDALLPAFGKDVELIKEELGMAIDKAGIRSRINELREELKLVLETDLSYEKIEKLQTKIREEIVAAIDMDILKKKIDDALGLPEPKVQETVSVGQFQG